MFISLLNNITLLVSLSIIHSLLLRYLKPASKRFRAFSGLLFGLVAITGMLNSVEIMPGIIFDGRSIILVTAAVFGGPLPAVIAMVASSVFRIYLGGAGTLMGVLVIVESGLLGMIFYYLRKKYDWASGPFPYFLLAMAVHLIMLALSASLPGTVASEVLPRIALPVLLLYPVATLLLFLLFEMQEKYSGLVNKLSDNEAALREANRIAGMGRWEFDLATNNLEWSEEIFDIFELDKKIFKPSYEAFLNKVHPEDRNKVDRAYKESLATFEPYDIEHRLLMSDGRVKWVSEKCRTDYSPEGTPVRSVGIVQEITAKKQAAEALEESRQMLRLIIDSIPVRVFWKDTGCSYLGCNIPFARDAGFDSPDQLIGLDDYQMGWIDQADLYRSDDKEVIQSGISKLNYEEPQTTPDGGMIWLRTSKVPLTDINGRVIGVLGTYEDITSWKKMEKELIVARDKAEESDKLKTAFLNNLSHEIRTPLNAIIGFSELLDKPETEQADSQGYAGIIQRCGLQLLSIIDDIFDIAAIETGQVKLFKKETDLKSLMSDLHEQFIMDAKKRNNELLVELAIPDEIQFVYADETKLFQIINNLLANAVKFTKNGTITLSCRKSGDNLEFSVRDNGIGISSELHEKIFERFRQGTTDATGEYGGSGLGLFIVRSYVELMGGSIELDSSPGKGSVFSFKIPLQPVAKKHKNTIHKDVKATCGHCTILVAEDNIDNYLLVNEYLSVYKCKIIHASDGREAVQLFKETTDICLVLMDIKMPVIDGFEATRQILEINPEMPVVALTAYDQPGDREKALRNGFKYYISKPFNKNDLYTVIDKCLNRIYLD